MNQILLLCKDTSVAQNQNKPKRNQWESDEVTNNYTPPIKTPSWCISHYYDPLDDPSGASDSGSGSGSGSFFPGIPPDTNPGIAPNTNPSIPSDTNPGEAPNTNPGYDPDTNTGYDPNTNIGYNPDTNIGIVSDPRPGFAPDTNPGCAPNRNLNSNAFDTNPSNFSTKMSSSAFTTTSGNALLNIILLLVQLYLLPKFQTTIFLVYSCPVFNFDSN